VGFPNAGKSTLLSVISNAIPKIASYPFTTLIPYVGMLEFNDYVTESVSVADMPGLIEGASRNRGLGHEFLKHIERTKVICYVLDMSGAELRDPFDDYEILRQELNLYNPSLLDRPFIIVANKMDQPKSKTIFKKFLKKANPNGDLFVLPISAMEKIGLEGVRGILKEMVSKQRMMEKQDRIENTV